jgi:hypothetical protein
VAFEVLHHHVWGAGLEASDIDDPRDVLALDLHRGARLAHEARGGFLVLERLRLVGSRPGISAKVPGSGWSGLAPIVGVCA